MPEGGIGEKPPARRALKKALLQEEGLDDVLDRVARLGKRGGDRLDTNRTAGEFLGDHQQIAPVHQVKADAVDVEHASAPCRR